MEISELALIAGTDIPFEEAQLVVHQPTIKEISFIGEETFFTGCELLRFSKDSLPQEDRVHLSGQTNFDIIMSIIKSSRDLDSKISGRSAILVLTLMFPDYQIQIKDNYIAFKKPSASDNQTIEEFSINNENYHIFKDILVTIFNLKGQMEKEYNPQGELARKIAEKLKNGRQKVQKTQGRDRKISILARYVSILAVGEQLNINDLLNYTVFQLHDQFERYKLKEKYGYHVQARMAGTKDLKEMEHWTKDLYNEEKNVGELSIGEIT